MRGRKPWGIEYIDQRPGSDEAKRRLRAIFASLHGDLRVCEACEDLNLSPQRFHDLREETVDALLEFLTPSKAGRPSTHTPEQERIRELEAQVERLELDLQAWKTKAEVAVILSKGSGEPNKKKRPRGRPKKT